MARSLKQEEIKHKINRRKEVTKIRSEINEMENKQQGSMR
jgi:hypothetical protein